VSRPDGGNEGEIKSYTIIELVISFY